MAPRTTTVKRRRLKPELQLAAASLLILSVVAATGAGAAEQDFVRPLPAAAIAKDQSPLGHWGPDAKTYAAWKTHTNRLVPVYTYGTRGAGRGIDLASYTAANSAYRSEKTLQRIYGRVPGNSLNPAADYMDQT